MNQKTAKLLKKWASTAAKKPREVKKWWQSLNRLERAAERRRIRAELDQN